MPAGGRQQRSRERARCAALARRLDPEKANSAIHRRDCLSSVGRCATVVRHLIRDVRAEGGMSGRFAAPITVRPWS
jgi:hypothetical protein